MTLDRASFASLVGLKEDTVRRSGSGRLLTDLSTDSVNERMPADGRARFLGTMTGGDDQFTMSRWWVPGFGRRALAVRSKKLTQVLARHQADEHEEVEQVAQVSLF